MQSVQVKLELGHRATFRDKANTQGFTHDWIVFVRGSGNESSIKHFVDKVVFQLHESFPRPKRVVKDFPFQVAESGYAGFLMPIEVHFKNEEEPKKVIFQYDLFLHLAGQPPVNHIRCEKLTFNNPSEDFRRKLIKAGGISTICPTEKAMASSLTQHFDDDLSCPVCLENFVGDNLPKDLDCPHVCCQICLNSIPTDIIGGLRCPQCQHITVIPPGGVSALRTNLRVRSLAEKLEDHRKANMSKMCTFHDDQEILFFCRTCSSAICQYCIINVHSEHKYEPIISVVKEQRQKLGRALQRVQAQIDKCEQNDRKITQNEEALVSKFQSAETKIDLRIQACLDEVNNQGRELKDKLHRLKAVTLETVQRHKQNNSECLRGKKKVLTEAQKTCDQTSDAEYMRLHDRWFGTIKTLIEDDSSSVAAVHPVESGFKLEVGPWNVNLGLNLMPEQALADSDHDVPSTSSAPQEDLGGRSDASNKRPSVYGNQVSTSTKRGKFDDDDEEVLLVSDTEDNDDDDTIFDLTDDPVVY